MNKCYRVYNNGDTSLIEDIPDEHLEGWKEGNTIAWFGCAQVVNGKVVYRGYLDASKLTHIDPSVTNSVPGF